MKLVHISDPHIHGEPVGGSYPVERFRRCLAHVEKLYQDADAVVVTGDLTHDGRSASYEALRAILAASPLKVHLLLGNHDHRGRFLGAFPDHPVDENGFVQQVADVSGYRLIMLDTNEPGTHAGHLCEKRRGWLSGRLEQARREAMPVLLFMHHNPAPVGVWSADVLSLIERDEFGAILRAHAGNIRHLFFGHTHYSLSGALEGIPFSAPRSTNHPCWPEIGNGHRAGFGPIAPNYNIALFTGSAVVVHTVDFMLEDEISWFEVPDEHSWRHGATPEP